MLDFVTVFAHELTLSPQQLPTYVEELTSTLASHCYKQQHAQQDSGQLAEFAGTPAQSFQRIEAAMTEGHPCFVANNGRIGVGRGDYLRYAPETGAETPLAGWRPTITGPPSPTLVQHSPRSRHWITCCDSSWARRSCAGCAGSWNTCWPAPIGTRISTC